MTHPSGLGPRSAIDLAIELLERRRQVGLERYGTPLYPGDARDLGQEADEELADWIIYWAGYRIQHAQRIQQLLRTIGEQQTEIEALRRAVQSPQPSPAQPPDGGGASNISESEV